MNVTISTPRRALAAAAVLAALVGAPGLELPSPVATAAAQEQAKGPKLTPAVAKKLKPAQEAIQKGDFDAGIQLSKEGLAEAKTDADRDISLRLLMAAYGGKKDLNAYAETTEQLMQLNPPSLTPEEKGRNLKALAQINLQNKNYEKGIGYAQQWADAGGGAEAHALVAAGYLVQKDCKNAVVALEKSVEGIEPNETQLKQLNYCYYQNEDKAKQQSALEALTVRFPSRAYFIDLLNLYQDQNADPRAVLNLYRLGFDRGWLERNDEYLEYAELALDAGSPAEALKVAETGTTKGHVPKSDRATRVLTQGKQLAAEDRRTIAQLDKEARAGKNGEADVKLGLAYLGMGENQKAVEAIQRGLQADRVGKVKRVDDANLMLGIAQLRLGNKAEAAKAFEAAKADPRMAKTADLWLRLQTAS